jgi:hypothetical protein
MASIALFQVGFLCKSTGNRWISGEVKWICSASSVISMRNPVNFEKDPLKTGGRRTSSGLILKSTELDNYTLDISRCTARATTFFTENKLEYAVSTGSIIGIQRIFPQFLWIPTDFNLLMN